MDAGSISQLMSLGPVGAILVALGAATWKVLAFLAKKLFSEELDENQRPKGLLVLMVKSHLDALDQQTTLSREIVARMDTLARQFGEEVKELRGTLRALATAQQQLAERHCHAPRSHVGDSDE